MFNCFKSKSVLHSCHSLRDHVQYKLILYLEALINILVLGASNLSVLILGIFPVYMHDTKNTRVELLLF